MKKTVLVLISMLIAFCPIAVSAVSDTKTWEDYLDKEFGELPDTSEFVNRWQKELGRVSLIAENANPPYSQMAVITPRNTPISSSVVVCP